MIRDLRVIGLMSGTSLDGLDLCLASFSEDEPGQWSYQIIATETVPYESAGHAWKGLLQKAYTVSPEHLGELNARYAAFLGRTAREFLDKRELSADLLCSHGHTILHRPESGITYQLGNHQNLADYSGIRSVCDFRQEDVLSGGQGAPLVPIGDALLFSGYDYCLNLGGFSNISFDNHGKRVAFDISPCNMLLNEIAGFQGLAYDESGRLARSGEVIESLLIQWDNLDFYRKEAPKSLGREWFEEHFYDLRSLSEKFGVGNLLCTATEHIARQIAAIIDSSGTVLVTGGGAHNEFLIERLDELCGADIHVPHADLTDYKEAMIFAFLGVLRINNRVNILASVTGAPKDHSSGVIFDIK